MPLGPALRTVRPEDRAKGFSGKAAGPETSSPGGLVGSEGSPGTHCSFSGLHSALQKSRILLPSDAHSSASPLPKDRSKAPSPKHLIFKFSFPGWAGWGALGEKAVIVAGESASRRGRGAALGDRLPALSLSGAPAHRAALPLSSRLTGATGLDPSPALPAGRWPETLSPPAAHPCQTHLAAPRSRRHARNWALARTRSCSRSSSAARCRTETRPRHCPAPAGRAGRARAVGLFGHPGSLPHRCHRRLPRRRRRLPLRRRCRCAPGLQIASWASLGRAHRTPAGPRLGSGKLRPQRQPGSEWSGAGRLAGCRGLRCSFLGAGKSGSLLAVRARLWLQEPPPGPPPHPPADLGWGQSSSGSRACPPSARLASHNAEREASRRATAAFL